MKRPNKYDFDFAEDYESNLETYCDELEKALDKACDVIVDMNHCTNLGAVEYIHCPFFDKEKRKCSGDRKCLSNRRNWKDWCLNDGEDKLKSI